tara:strand:+ start:84 stop:563 length:480 start_codon:yes stop_codon:yes gene_type:complete
MKLTTEDLRIIIKEELEQMFDINTGKVKESEMTRVLRKAAMGVEEAQEAVFHAADALRTRAGLNFSTQDGTPMNKKAIAQKYGLDPKTGKKISKKQAPQKPQKPQVKKAPSNDSETDSDRLKRAQKFFSDNAETDEDRKDAAEFGPGGFFDKAMKLQKD